MIKLLVMDVDGTLTDNGIYYDSTGNELKKFGTRDGAGLMIAKAAGIDTMICTGRECIATSRRAADLKIKYVLQNVKDKAAFLADFLAQNGLSREEVAYCGDDLNDLAAMRLCGFVACPVDAPEEIQAEASFVAPVRGGDGMVRAAIEHILKTDGRWKQAVKDTFHVEL